MEVIAINSNQTMIFSANLPSQPIYSVYVSSVLLAKTNTGLMWQMKYVSISGFCTAFCALSLAQQLLIRFQLGS